MPNGLEKALDLAQNLAGILALVFYVAIVLWTYKDARRRIDDPILIATAVACSMLPLVGVLVYMMLRPPEYLADVRERELEIRAMERTLGQQERCPNCRSHIESNYLACPICMYKLRQPCTTCDRPLDPRWTMCPFCETNVSDREPVSKRGPSSSSARPSSSVRSERETEPSSSSAPKGRSERAPRTPRASGSPSSSSGASRSADSKPATRPKHSSPSRAAADDKSSKAGIDTEPLTPDQPTMAMSTPKNKKDK